MDESAFETAAADAIRRVADRIDDEHADIIDVELRGGILTLEAEDGRQIVINKHTPNRQIWMASPVGGARHFVWNGTAWRSTRSQETLAEALAQDLRAITGVTIAL
jgi:frataxin